MPRQKPDGNSYQHLLQSLSNIHLKGKLQTTYILYEVVAELLVHLTAMVIVVWVILVWTPFKFYSPPDSISFFCN